MNRVAVTGLGAVTPLGNDIGTLWKNLISGTCGIGQITKFDTASHKASVAAEVKDFDPKKYMDNGEIRHSDLYSQFAVASACQAMEDSGISGSVAPERFGVYFGSGIGGIQTFSDTAKTLFEKGPRRVSPFFIPSLIANMASGMIAIRFNCQGAAMPSVTACASGSNAIGEAMRAIRHGYCDAVIAGGAEAAITEIGVAGFANMQALSTSDDPVCASLPFDSRRKGFVIGEGAGALILEEYEHAKARGAKIYAEVCGYGSTCDAYHITAPDPEAGGGARAIADAAKEAGLTDKDIIYVNAHGTGTPLNDKSETLALKKAFGEKRAHELIISSTKSMTGHMLGAAGAVEAIASILALNNGIIPPTINLAEPDPECDLFYTPNSAIEASCTLALSTSLGFGGHNACLAFRKAAD